MEFCPSCGSAILPEKQDGRVVSICRRCGYTTRERIVVTALNKPDQTVFVIPKDPS